MKEDMRLGRVKLRIASWMRKAEEEKIQSGVWPRLFNPEGGEEEGYLVWNEEINYSSF